MGDRDVVAEAIDSLARKIDAIPTVPVPVQEKPKWTWRDTAHVAIVVGLVAWSIACQARYATELSVMQATILDLRRIIAMQREDPKAFPRLKKQFEEIEKYESGNGGSGRNVR